MIFGHVRDPDFARTHFSFEMRCMCAARTAWILPAPLIRAWPWRLRVLGIRGMIIMDFIFRMTIRVG